jgi:hypothetical protein
VIKHSAILLGTLPKQEIKINTQKEDRSPFIHVGYKNRSNSDIRHLCCLHQTWLVTDNKHPRTVVYFKPEFTFHCDAVNVLIVMCTQSNYLHVTCLGVTVGLYITSFGVLLMYGVRIEGNNITEILLMTTAHYKSLLTEDYCLLKLTPCSW